MNKNQIKGKARDTIGNVQAAVGNATGNTHKLVEGLKQQSKGTVKHLAGTAHHRQGSTT